MTELQPGEQSGLEPAERSNAELVVNDMLYGKESLEGISEEQLRSFALLALERVWKPTKDMSNSSPKAPLYILQARNFAQYIDGASKEEIISERQQDDPSYTESNFIHQKSGIINTIRKYGNGALRSALLAHKDGASEDEVLREITIEKGIKLAPQAERSEEEILADYRERLKITPEYGTAEIKPAPTKAEQEPAIEETADETETVELAPVVDLTKKEKKSVRKHAKKIGEMLDEPDVLASAKLKARYDKRHERNPESEIRGLLAELLANTDLRDEHFETLTNHFTVSRALDDKGRYNYAHHALLRKLKRAHKELASQDSNNGDKMDGIDTDDIRKLAAILAHNPVEFQKIFHQRPAELLKMQRYVIRVLKHTHKLTSVA